MKENNSEKIHKNAVALAGKCLLAFIIPLTVCLVYCFFRGVSFADLYLPNSSNNDSLFYYKLVEGTVKYGIPRGCFGFDESSALYGTYAAWSPLIFLPWILWGFVFGWNFASVFVCNTVVLSVALLLFVLLTDADLKAVLFVMASFILFPSIPIHILNALPETCILAVTLIFFALAVRVSKGNNSKVSIIIMFVLIFYLTLIRPYMVLFSIIPIWLGIKGKRKYLLRAIVFVAFCILSGTVYCLISHFLTSDYFEPLFKLDIVKMIFQRRTTEAFWTSVYVFKDMLKGIGEYIRDAFSFGFTAGTQYVIFLLVSAASFIMCFDKREKEKRLINIVFTVTVSALLFSIVFFLQKTNEGGRHVWVFAVTGLVLIACSNWGVKNLAMKTLLLLLLTVFVIRGSWFPTDYDIPIMNPKTKENVAEWEKVFDDEKIMEMTDGFGFDNTVIWVFIDYDDGKQVVTEFSELFVLPEGMGISCCYPDYVLENADNIKSRYLITYSGGEIDEFCSDSGREELYRNEKAVMYKIY